MKHTQWLLCVANNWGKNAVLTVFGCHDAKWALNRPGNRGIQLFMTTTSVNPICRIRMHKRSMRSRDQITVACKGHQLFLYTTSYFLSAISLHPC